MLELNYSDERPDDSATAIQRIWNAVQIKLINQIDQPIDTMVNALNKTHSNGGARFAKFKIEGNSCFNWFMSRNRWNEIEFPENFFRAKNVVAAFPELCVELDQCTLGFEWGSSFTLAGEIAWTLALGGAYDKHPGGSANAYQLAENFRIHLFGDRFDDMLVLKSSRPWSAWFYGIAWDSSWIMIDKRQSHVSVLAVSDTD
jgi:hypothetical protein